jgi:hypothetical protein
LFHHVKFHSENCLKNIIFDINLTILIQMVNKIKSLQIQAQKKYSLNNAIRKEMRDKID